MELPYDLTAACEENGIDASDIAEVVLEITGENDGADWHWICRTATGFAYVHGGCGYTGWDCCGSAERHDAETLDRVLQLVPQDERRVFELMQAAGLRVAPAAGLKLAS